METTYDLTTSAYPVIGAGGTKTAYLIDDKIVVFRPNAMDGQRLINIWDRIITDELMMSELLHKIGILNLNFKLCQIKLNQTLTLQTLCSQSFKSEISNGLYIIDTKNINSSTWPKDNSISFFAVDVDPYNVDNWLKAMESYILDVNTLVKNNLSLCGDSLNFAFAAKGSKYHSGSDQLFEIRIFGFDFTSKYSPLKLENKVPTSVTIDYMLRRGGEAAVWEVLCSKSFCLKEKEDKLYKELSEKLVSLYHARYDQ